MLEVLRNRGRGLCALVTLGLATLGFEICAHAERYIVQRGETLEHVARSHGCTTAAVKRANHVETTLVAAGTAIEIPPCTPPAPAPVQTHRSPGAVAASGDTASEAKARQALAVIDGATWTAASLHPPSGERLDHGRQLGAGQGYEIRRPWRAYGAAHVIAHMRRTIAEVRALYPDVHTLAIGDLSAEHGGKIPDHRSHRSGLDVDVGFYYKHMPAGYPAHFARADATLDLEATWALLTAFARTASRDDGVAVMFLDYDVQHRLYDWARRRGTPEADLDFMFQYPRDRDSSNGLIRHWPQHADHVHVRFKPHSQPSPKQARTGAWPYVNSSHRSGGKKTGDQLENPL